MRRFMYIFLGIVVVFSFAGIVVFSQSKFGKTPDGKRLERIRKSPNYKDGSFQNINNTPVLTGSAFSTFASWIFKKKVRVTPEDQIPSIKTNLLELDSNKNIFVWFGHSSYFMQIDGKKILVDPVLSGHASPFSWTIKAFKGSDAYKPEDIPNIDYLIITHDHWDHLDYKTIIKLKSRVKYFICSLGVGEHLENWEVDGNSIIEMDWNDEVKLDSGFVINATPARHFSGRGLKRNKTLWASFVLKSPTMKIFIGGDGGYDTHFAEIGKKFGPFDIAFLEQGQYNEKWKYIHLLPEQAFHAAQDIRAKAIVPVHNSKFALGQHPWDEPLKKITENNEEGKIAVMTPVIGQQVYLNGTIQHFSHWWKGLE